MSRQNRLRYRGMILLEDGIIHELSCRTKHDLYRALRRRMRKLRGQGEAPRFLEACRI